MAVSVKKIVGVSVGVLLGLLVLLTAALAGLLFTSGGLSVLAGAAERFVPGLTLGEVSGRVDRLEVKRLAYSMPGVDVAADRVALNLDLRRLADSLARVNAVELDGLRLRVDTAAMTPSDPEPETDEPLEVALPSPWRAELGKLSLKDLEAEIDGTRVTLSRFETGASFEGKQLRLSPTVLETVRVKLADNLMPKDVQEEEVQETPKESAEELPQIARMIDELFGEPILAALPEVKLPVDFDVADFRLTDARLEAAEAFGSPTDTIDSFTFAARGGGSAVELPRLGLRTPAADLNLSAKATLSGAWPVEAQLALTAPRGVLENLASALPEVPGVLEANRPAGETPVRLDLELSGEVLGEVSLRLGIDGLLSRPVALDASARLHEAYLPAKLSLRLPKFTYRLPEAQAQLTEGEKASQKAETAGVEALTLDFAGDMRSNTLELRTAARLDAPSLGVPEPLTATLVMALDGRREGLALRKLELMGLSALTGGLRLEGALDWTEGILWSGKLATTPDLRSKALLPEMPFRVAASMDSVFHLLPDAAWRADVSNLAFEGDIAGTVLHAGGGAHVTSALEAVLRALEVRLGENRVTVDGSLAWPVSAALEARIDAPALGKTLPGFDGTAQGLVKLEAASGVAALAADLEAKGLKLDTLRLGRLTLRSRMKSLPNAHEAPIGDLSQAVLKNRFEGTLGLSAKAFEMGEIRLSGVDLSGTFSGHPGEAPKTAGEKTSDTGDAGLEALLGGSALDARVDVKAGRLTMPDAALEGATLAARVTRDPRESRAAQKKGEANLAEVLLDAGVGAKIDLAAGRFDGMGMKLRSALLKGDLRTLAGGEIGGNAALTVSGLDAGEGVAYPKAEVTLTGRESRHELKVALTGEPVGGGLAASGSFSREKLDWTGTLRDAKFTTPAGEVVQSAPVPIAWRNAQQRLTAGAHCWRHASAEVCLTENLEALVGAQSGHAAVELKKFDLAALKPLLPNRRDRIEGLVTAKVKANWNFAKAKLPVISAEVKADGASYSTRVEGTRLPLTLETARVTATVDDRAVKADLTVKPEGNGTIHSSLTVEDPAGARRMRGTFTIDDITPHTIQPLLARGEKVEAHLRSDLRASGTLEKPRLEGEIRLENILVEASELPFTMKPSEILLRFEGDSSTLEGSFNTTEGGIAITGGADWRDLSNWKARIAVALAEAGKALRVYIPSLATVDVAPDIVAEASNAAVSVKGTVTIPQATIKVEEVPESSVGTSGDTVMLNENLEPEAEASAAMPVDLDVGVEIQNTTVSAYGLNAKLEGSLRAMQTDQGLGIHGQITIPEGRFHAYGQDLIVEEGTILFSGPAANPGLNIKAVRNEDATEDDVEVGILVTGTANRPKVEIFSDPTMSQEERLSYLVRGQGLDSLSGSESSMMTGMLISMGASQGNPTIGKIGDAVGISNLSIDTAGVGDSSQVVVSGNITDDLQLKYGVGIFDSIATITLRYRLMPKLYLEAVSGVDQAIDLLYQYNF